MSGEVLTRSEFAARLLRAREEGLETVFTNGCFDLLHVGHLRYLRAARAEGDLLAVAVNTDESLRRLKGQGRPLVPCEERKELLAALDCVDFVTDFHEETPHALLRECCPKVLIKGGDYTHHQVEGWELVEADGGRVAVLSFVPGRSTTDIVRAAARAARLESMEE